MNSQANTHTPASLFTRWEEFWLAPESPLIAGLLRWFVGGMLLYSQYVWGLELNRFFGPDGLMAADVVADYQKLQFVPSFWWMISPSLMPLTNWLMMGVLFVFMIGFLTPVTSIAALVIAISNSQRAPLANYGLDQILSMLTLYLTIAGAGGAFSLDRLVRHFWKYDHTQLQHSFWVGPPTSRSRLGLRLIQVHYCIIYFFAGLSKLQGETWWNGDAMWLAIANREYQSWDLTWLAHYPRFTEFMTHLTILWEISFAYLIWYRTIRLPYLLIGAGMHMGIVLFLGMPTFGLIMIYGYIAFIPAAWLTDAADRLRQSPAKAIVQVIGSVIPARQTVIALGVLCLMAVCIGLLNRSYGHSTLDQLNDYASQAYLQEERGEFADAVAAMTNAIRLDPERALLYYDRAVYYERLQQWHKAIEDYTQAIRLDPNLQRAYNNRGLILMQQQKQEQALEDFQQAMQLDPSDPLPFQNRGELFLDQGNMQRAYEDFSQAIARAYDRPLLYVLRAEVALELGHLYEAIEDLGRARLLDPTHPGVLQLEQICRERLGNQAQKESQQTLPIIP